MNSDGLKMITRKLPRPLMAGAAALAAAAVLVTSGCSADQKPAYEITTVQRGTFSFTPSPQDLASGAVVAEQCEGNICGCEADIQKVTVLGGDGGASQINKTLESYLAPQCSADYIKSTGKPVVTMATDQIFSVTTDQLTVMRGASGACQGSTTAQTFDRKTGKEILLTDAVSAADLPAIFRLVAQDITQQQNTRNPGTANAATVEAQLAGTRGELGLIVERGSHGGNVVKVHVGETLFSCADGASFSAVLPSRFIQNTVLKSAL